MSELNVELRQKIKVLSETIWDGRALNEEVDAWLSNFDEDVVGITSERLHALYLLSRFMYFSSEEIRELLKSVYRDLYKYPIIKAIRKGNSDTRDRELINRTFHQEESETRFLAVGNPSESGSHLLYYFRQENELPKDIFISPHEIFDLTSAEPILANEAIKRYVFIDDFCGSGIQATKYLKDLVAKVRQAPGDVTISYFVMFGDDEGLNELRTKTEIDNCDAVFRLDESYKCFGSNSQYIPDVDINELDWDFAKQMAEKHGLHLWPDYPFGYEGCELLIGFFHNTPDNTLPIIWDEQPNWKPIFRRYPKFENAYA